MKKKAARGGRPSWGQILAGGGLLVFVRVIREDPAVLVDGEIARRRAAVDFHGEHVATIALHDVNVGDLAFGGFAIDGGFYGARRVFDLDGLRVKRAGDELPAAVK